MTSKFYVNKHGFGDNTIAVERVGRDNYVSHLNTGATSSACWYDKDFPKFTDTGEIIEVEDLNAAKLHCASLAVARSNAGDPDGGDWSR